MDESNNLFQMFPIITVSTECQILMQNNDEQRRCQLDAFDVWIRPWQSVPQTRLTATGLVNLPTKNNCCYRWFLLDCLTESVQNNCPNAANFDLR